MSYGSRRCWPFSCYRPLPFPFSFRIDWRTVCFRRMLIIVGNRGTRRVGSYEIVAFIFCFYEETRQLR
jgi:hypothetical protein